MYPPRNWFITRGAVILSVAVIAALSAPGCSQFGGAEPAPRQPWGDSMGAGLRGIPDEPAASSAAQPAKKQPFWEKYRDQRVHKINEHLSVDEPTGW